MNEFNHDFAIVGAGWLGRALAQALIDDGQTAITTCRAPEKKERLLSEGLDVVTYQLGDDLQNEMLKPVLQANVLILNIAPGKMKQDIEYFIQCMKDLIDGFMGSSIKPSNQSYIVFISSISVYGERARVVTEDSVVEPKTASAKAHVEIERYLHQQYATAATVLRLAGLVGADRHPVRQLVKKSPLASANKHVNLVDRVDVIDAIKAIYHQEVWGHLLHLCSHDHPTRADYYTWAAEKLGLPIPEFTDEKAGDAGKVIDSTATCERLGLKLRYDSPYKILAD